MYKDPTDFRKRFLAYKDGKMPYKNGRPIEDEEYKLPKFEDGTQPNLFQRPDKSYFYQNGDLEVDVFPLISPTGTSPETWTFVDNSGKIYTPQQQYLPDQGEIVQGVDKNAGQRFWDNYTGELKYNLNNGRVIGGKYTIPAIAASALLPLAGEAFAGTSIAGIPATTWADAALTAGFGAHGLNHAINEGINGIGDATMTALEVAPLGRLAKPMFNETAMAIENYRYPLGRPQIPENFLTIKPQVRTIEIKPSTKLLRVVSEGTYPIYRGRQHSVREVVNPDGTVNPRQAMKILHEVSEQFPGSYKMEHRLENPEWHQNDPTTYHHTKNVALSAWGLDVPYGFTKQDLMVAALGHDFGKIVAGDGHAQIGADLAKQVFPDLTEAQYKAIAEHMGTPTTPLGKVTKLADINNGLVNIFLKPNASLKFFERRPSTTIQISPEELYKVFKDQELNGYYFMGHGTGRSNVNPLVIFDNGLRIKSGDIGNTTSPISLSNLSLWPHANSKEIIILPGRAENVKFDSAHGRIPSDWYDSKTFQWIDDPGFEGSGLFAVQKPNASFVETVVNGVPGVYTKPGAILGSYNTDTHVLRLNPNSQYKFPFSANTAPEITAENAASEMPNIVRTVQDNGKIRLSLPSHTDNKPRQFVLEPAPEGNNKYYVHMRMWDDIENKVPASNVTNEEKQQLFDALYDELPEGAEILFPKSGPGNYGTRGTVVGLQRLSRDPRFTPGTKGTLQYLDKDGKTVRTYEGTSFIKTPRITEANAASITPEQWTTAQDAAVARGDMVEAQRLRDLHFKVSAPNTKTDVPLWTSSEDAFNSFDLSHFGETDSGFFGYGHYLTPIEKYAATYHPINRKFYANIENPYIGSNDQYFNRIQYVKDRLAKRKENVMRNLRDGKLTKFSKKLGINENTSLEDAERLVDKYIADETVKWNDKYVKYADEFKGKDGVLSWRELQGIPNKQEGIYREVVVPRGEQIKSADAITYDDKGIRIPLGKRDNFKLNDIRYGLLPFLGIGAGYGLYNQQR